MNIFTAAVILCLLLVPSSASAAPGGKQLASILERLDTLEALAPVNVLNCVGDGFTDNFSCFEDELNSALPGSTVLVLVGTYLVSDTIHIPEKIILIGEHPKGTIVQTTGNFPRNSPVISMTDVDGICSWTAVKNMRINAYNADIGIYSNCANEGSGVYDVEIYGFKDIGILFEITTSAGPNHYSLVNVGLHISKPPGPTDSGIVINVGGGRAWVVQGVTITTDADGDAGVGSVAFNLIAGHSAVLNTVHFEGYDVGIRLGLTRNITILNAHGHRSMNEAGSVLKITKDAHSTIVIGLAADEHSEGYVSIDDERNGLVITDKWVPFYVSE